MGGGPRTDPGCVQEGLYLLSAFGTSGNLSEYAAATEVWPDIRGVPVLTVTIMVKNKHQPLVLTWMRRRTLCIKVLFKFYVFYRLFYQK